MPDLCQLEDVKEWLGIAVDNTKADALLARLISATSADFLREIDRGDLAPKKSYTDVLELHPHDLSRPRLSSCYDGGDSLSKSNVRLSLNHWPIETVTSVELDGTAITASGDGIADGWFFDADEEPEYRNTLQLVGAVLSNRYARSTVKVVYDAGYDAIPDDVTQAAIEWVAYRYTSRQWIGQTSKHMAQGETVSYQNVDAPPSVKRVIENYSRPAGVL